MIFIAAFQTFKVMGTCWGNITPASYARGDILDLWLALAGRLVNKKKGAIYRHLSSACRMVAYQFLTKGSFFSSPHGTSRCSGKICRTDMRKKEREGGNRQP